MNRIPLLVLTALLLVTTASGQTGEEASSPQDSLQVTEETGTSSDSPSDETSEDPAEETSESPAEETSDSPLEETVEEAAEVRVPGQPTAVLTSFFEALKAGDSYMVSQLISEDGLEDIDVMLEILKENLDDDPETVMSRLAGAGYTATEDEVEDWSAMEYLTATVELSVMKARYSMYQMEIGEFTVSGDRIQIPLTFTTASGIQLPFQAELVKVRDDWRVSTFMGLNSFP